MDRSHSRRTFLAGFAVALQAAEPTDNSESFWRMVRAQFPLDDNLIYLNAANVCPASRPVMDRHLAFLRDFQSNPSFQNRDKYTGLREKLRSRAATMLGVTADEIAITRNTSEGTNVVVKGIDLKPGEEVVITDHNHPSNLDSWNIRARREGIVVKPVAVTAPARSPQDLVAALEKAITPKTRVLSITHLTSTTGILFPAKEVGALARKYGLHYHLDGAQTFGALDFNLRDIGCDSWSTSAHKWAMGPLEAGLLYVRADRIPKIWPSIVTAGWGENLKGARKLEVFGQRDDPRVVALDSALEFLQMVGMPRIEARVRALSAHAKTELAKLGNVKLKTNRQPEMSGGVIKFQLTNVATKKAYDSLWENHRLAIASTPSGDSEGLRFSPHIYNSSEDIDRAVAAVRKLSLPG